jgi:homopolymeric O-antigen transport system ATP-binding protein
MKPILEIQNVSKIFRIHHERHPYLSIRDSLSSLFKSKSDVTENFHALKDVSFEVKAGESIGIVGKNGAGKSTLLKILSKITPPTSGRIISRGRIASLLEVGTGFHPELTGRENVFLNGSILGMKRKEILSKFDEIIDFAGVEKFLDTPLKHYSSGMQLRLAFAVAAFLEPEVLVIDEVLAVGDAEFQKKCMGKMNDVSKSGRTILFVSHNMAAVQALCQKSILLQKGQLALFDTTQNVLNAYQNVVLGTANQNGIHEFPEGKKDTYISKIEFLCDGVNSETLYMGCEFEILVHFKSKNPLEYPLLGIVIQDQYNSPLLSFNHRNYSANELTAPLSEGILSVKLPFLPLMSGTYAMDIYFANMFTDLDVKKNSLQFKVEYKHFSDKGEMLDERFNKFFIENVIWETKTRI